MSDKILAVIGHVDHGKTALVKALTGIETDRLKEEQARGLSIALGFAHLGSDDAICHLVDTPGHADFVRTTASGLSGADVLLLVVSAPDGIAVQTRDYVKMAGLFGLNQAVVALTKSDLASSEQIAETRRAVGELLAAHGMTQVCAVDCSAMTGEGIEELRSTLLALHVSDEARGHPSMTYLPIDRVFAAPGRGTIVTGSLIGGRLHQEDEVRIDPSGLEATVRGLQVAGHGCESVSAGNRVAVNLRGVEVNEIKTGDVLCVADALPPSAVLDVALTFPAGNGCDLKHMEQVQVLIGTRALSAKVRLLTPANAQDDEAASFAQLELARPHLAFRGQRTVLRRPATSELIAGAVVLDPAATKIARNKTAHAAVLRAAHEQSPQNLAKALAERDRGCVRLDQLERLSGQPIDLIRPDLDAGFEVDDGSYAFEKTALAEIEKQFVQALDRLHVARPIRPYVPVSELHRTLASVPKSLMSAAQNALKERGEVHLQGAFIWLDRHASGKLLEGEVRTRIEAAEMALQVRGLAPKQGGAEDVDATEIADIEERLIWMGHAKRLHNIGLSQSIILHSDAISAALESLRTAFGEAQSFTTGQARERLQTNRKIIVPLLEYFDQAGATVRQGDLRQIVACPRSEEG